MVRFLQQQRIRPAPFIHRIMNFFVERLLSFLAAVLFKPIIEGVAHDAQQPGAAIPAAEPSEKFEGAQVSFLHDVLRVGIVGSQPARQ